MKKEVHMGESSTRSVTKKELIKLIEDNFDDDSSNIATITTVKDTIDYKNQHMFQSITFAKLLEFD